MGDIAQQFQLDCRGDADTDITGIASLPDARQGQLAFLFKSAYKPHLATTKASAVVLRAEDAKDCPLPYLISDRPRLAWATIASLFDPSPRTLPMIHPTAVIADSASIGKGVAIGAHTVIGSDVVVEDGAMIGPSCFVGDASVVGSGTRLVAQVCLYHDVVLGSQCLVHAGAVIGADGFGFELDPASGDYVKIPQVYGVRIGHGVEIGAGTTIDRGALNHTSLGDHCKLDNQVQIGHGTTVGEHTVISGCTAIAGSTVLGSYCLIGGGVGIIDNIEIADRVEVTAMKLVSRSISEPGRYSSGTGLMRGNAWKRSVVGFSRLDDMRKRLRKLEAGQK
ncbi:MAG: UDP-3-O-(3-hydroxymyristoyl)glucosamine N-acyltransferase [Pseudomonadales bacterium]